MKLRLSMLMMSILALAAANGSQLSISIANKSSEFTSANRLAVHAVDGSGLSGGNHNTDPQNMWLNSGDGTFPGGTPASDPDRPGQLAHITFDLGGTFFVDSFHIWNYNEVNANTQQSFTSRSVQTLTISIASVVGGPYTQLIDPLNNSTTWVFNQAPGNSSYAGQIFTLNLPVQAAFVRFDILSNYGDTNGLVGLSEVEIFGSIPEPATSILLGFGVATLAAARKKRG